MTGPTAWAAYQNVVERVRRAIHLGVYVAGDRLPPERELAPALGVSRATLREALRVLEGEGLVESRRGATGGTVVLPAATAAPPAGIVQAQLEAFENLLDFRLATECAAARLAARRRSEDDLRTMGESQEGIRRHTSIDLFRRVDTSFHLAIAGAARNAMLLKAIEEGRAAMYLPLDLLDFEVMRTNALEGHRVIMHAIAAANPEAAERAMAAHIEDTRRELRLVTALAEDKVV
ncbi:MAG TPA: GntR family transcriptional regulator [Chloroflexota bacterium]|nr:GntR family transcriptional regulator [Chloroflexota bacterium]